MDLTEFYDELMCEYAEALYQKMASKKYGVKFCCEKNLLKLEIKKEKLYLNDISDCNII